MRPLLRFGVWIGAAALCGGCGLLFGDRDTSATGGDGGTGGAPTTATTDESSSASITTGSAGGEPCFGVTAEGSEWMLSFSGGEVTDLSLGPNGVLAVARTDGLCALPDVQAGPRTLLLKIDEATGAVADVVDFGPNVDVRLSRGAGAPHVAWTSGNRVCAAPVSGLASPGPGSCGPTAVVSCTSAAALLDPSVAVGDRTDEALVAFLPTSAGTLACETPSIPSQVRPLTPLFVDSLGGTTQLAQGSTSNGVRLVGSGTNIIGLAGRCNSNGNVIPGVMGSNCPIAPALPPHFFTAAVDVSPKGDPVISNIFFHTHSGFANFDTDQIVASFTGIAWTSHAEGERYIAWRFVSDPATPHEALVLDPGWDTELATAVRSVSGAAVDTLILAGVLGGTLGDLACTSASPCGLWARAQGDTLTPLGFVLTEPTCASTFVVANGGLENNGFAIAAGEYGCGRVQAGDLVSVPATSPGAFIARVAAP